MGRVFIVLVLMCSTHMSHARPSQTPSAQALTLVAKGSFSEAIPRLQQALVEGGDAVTLHVALAKCYFYTKKHERARLEVEAALEKNRELTLDPLDTPPDFFSFFDGIASKPRPAPKKPVEAIAVPALAAASEPLRPNPKQLEPPPGPATQTVFEPATAPAVLKPVYVPAAASVRWLPLGIGQFLNGDPVGGGVFLALQTSFVGANVAFTVLNALARAKTGQFPVGAQWPAFYALQHVTAGCAVITAILGVIDAYVWSPARARTRAESRLSLSVASSGVGVSF